MCVAYGFRGMSSAPRAISNDVPDCNHGKANSSGCPTPMFAATARVIGRQLHKRYVLRPGARCCVNMSVRRRTAVLARGGGVCAVASVVLLSVCAGLIALCLLQHAYERALRTSSLLECCCCCRSKRGLVAELESQRYEKAPSIRKLLRVAGKPRRLKEKTVSAGLLNENEIVCRQFDVYHRRSFEEFLDETEIGVPASSARSGFHGHRLVDWLLDAGLVRNRDEGVVYGRRLLDGGLLVHAERAMHFYDGPYDYAFAL
ncbi:hypothetical protein HPB50_021372 [Hyalomma asiaticum]|uniref:Uncharacterized protein n=1 Tax=Hyalomma asiaticum TaxID=266040 RepID=A0ACB7SYE6_HYAAI|nr:hypothetical protein HPB50_021372 [Hyalomma asiaticum]